MDLRSKRALGLPTNNDTATGSLDDFVLRGLRRTGSTPQLIVARSLTVAAFMKEFAQSPLATPPLGGCPAATLVHSKYELMVADFPKWAERVLEHAVAGKGQRHTLLKTLQKQYKTGMLASGSASTSVGRKPMLQPGASIARLRRTTVRDLKLDASLAAALRGLDYDWLGH